LSEWYNFIKQSNEYDDESYELDESDEFDEPNYNSNELNESDNFDELNEPDSHAELDEYDEKLIISEFMAADMKIQELSIALQMLNTQVYLSILLKLLNNIKKEATDLKYIW
ncbi:7282_t:CDS:1, partial [Ambispora leptoticha]